MKLETIRELLYLPPPFGRRGLALLIFRSLVGIAFLFHGYGKAVDISEFAAEFQIPMPIAAAAAYAQLVAGVLLLVGLATPLAAMTIAGTMSVATLKLMSRGEPFVSPHGHGYEASLFYLVAGIALVLLGPGAYSFDAFLLERRSGATAPRYRDQHRR